MIHAESPLFVQLCIPVERGIKMSRGALLDRARARKPGHQSLPRRTKRGVSEATKSPHSEGLWALRGRFALTFLPASGSSVTTGPIVRAKWSPHPPNCRATPTRKMSNLRARGGVEGVACVCGSLGGTKELPAGQPTPQFAEVAYHSPPAGGPVEDPGKPSGGRSKGAGRRGS